MLLLIKGPLHTSNDEVTGLFNFKYLNDVKECVSLSRVGLLSGNISS